MEIRRTTMGELITAIGGLLVNFGLDIDLNGGIMRSILDVVSALGKLFGN